MNNILTVSSNVTLCNGLFTSGIATFSNTIFAQNNLSWLTGPD